MLLALVASLALAGCHAGSDTAAKQPRTLLNAGSIAALHFDEAFGSALVNKAPTGVGEGRIAIAFCAWPSVTFSYVSTLHGADTTNYVVEGSNGFHPRLSLRGDAGEIQKRWRDSSIFHPMVSLAVGTLSAKYAYSHRLPNGSLESVVEGPAKVTYYAPTVGLEASVAKYMTTYILFGTRVAGRVRFPGLDEHAFDGGYVVIGFGFGKFR